MNGELSQEDQTILAAFGSLENGEDRVPGTPGGSEAAETLARLYTEVMGLVPYELAPAAPSPDLKVRLMARVTGSEAAAAADPEPAAAPLLAPVPEDGDETQEVEPRPGPRPDLQRPVPVARPAQPPQASQEVRVPPGRVAMVSQGPGRWPLGLAAALVVLLGGLAGWLGLRYFEQQQTIAQLEGDLAEARQQAQQSAEARASFERMRENFAMMTTPAVTVSPLRPVPGAIPGAAPAPENARGVLYVAPDHQHWYLAVHGLPPAAEGRTYQLWWVADGRMVSGGTFDPQPSGEKVELSSKTMPANTRDVVVTLEPEGGAPAPTGPEVLRAAGVYQIL